MKAIIYHSLSKSKSCKNLALNIEGDHFEVTGVKKNISFVPFQMFVYGYKTVANRKIKLLPLEIDFEKYDEVVLVSPVWASRVNAFMRQFLIDNPFEQKKVTIIGSSKGGYKGYFDTFKKYLNDSNEIVDAKMYVKGTQV